MIIFEYLDILEGLMVSVDYEISTCHKELEQTHFPPLEN